MSTLEKYKNKILNCDVMEVLHDLPDNCIDMVYADPDYNVGIKYAGKNYTTEWSKYIEWYSALISESMRVLKPTGNLFTINYPKQNAFLWTQCLDAIAYDVHEYVWIYNCSIGFTNRRFTTAHRTILHATNSKDNAFYKDQVAQPYMNQKDKRIKYAMDKGSPGRMPYSWFYYDIVKNTSSEKTDHPCQIPSNLSRMLVNASTKPNDIVFILFGGSGSEVVQARQMGRQFISCELSVEYYNLIRKRLYNDGIFRK